MDLSIVIIFREEDTHYLKTLLATLPKDVEIVVCKTIPVKEGLCLNDQQAIEEGNIVFAKYYYKEFDFAEARNYAKRFAKKSWIFSLDADEYLSPRALGLIKDITENIDSKIGGILCRIADAIPNEQTYMHSILRLFRNHKDIKFEFACHEQIYDNIVNAGFLIGDSNIFIEHTGYLVAEDKLLEKLQRNFELLTREYVNQKHELKRNYLKNHIIQTSAKIFELQNKEN